MAVELEYASRIVSLRVINLVSRGREPSLRPPVKVAAREGSTGAPGRLIEKSEMEKGVPFTGERGKRAGGVVGRGVGWRGTARSIPTTAASVARCGEPARPALVRETPKRRYVSRALAHSALLLPLAASCDVNTTRLRQVVAAANARGAVPFAPRVENAEEYLRGGGHTVLYRVW